LLLMGLWVRGQRASVVHAQRHIHRRLAERAGPREGVYPVALLASPRAASVTGAEYVIDGGTVPTV
jgi:NAD(P)-dependent dehydrogenase (short-subunit alcohol dehydrogenase family)